MVAAASNLKAREALESIVARLRGSRSPFSSSAQVELATECVGHQKVGREESVSLEWPELDALLPDGGFPRGVSELMAPHLLGGTTAIALALIRAVHSRDPRAWAAWMDPERTLYAPGVAKAGVDLMRLLVVRPERSKLPRIAVKLANAQAFDVIVIDFDPPLCSSPFCKSNPGASREAARFSAKRKNIQPEVLVRKLAIAAEQTGARILLLTDALRARSAVLPVALRLECSRTNEHAIQIRIAKERRGRVGLSKTIPFESRPQKIILQDAG